MNMLLMNNQILMNDQSFIQFPTDSKLYCTYTFPYMVALIQVTADTIVTAVVGYVRSIPVTDNLDEVGAAVFR